MENNSFNVEIDIRPSLQSMLDQTFPNIAEKRKIIKRTSEYAFACPICGDSHNKMSAKRGTLYFNTLKYRCYNCGHKTTYLTLLKNFDIDIDPFKKLEITDYVREKTDRIHFSEEDFLTNNLDKLIDLSDLSNYLNTHDDSKITNFRPVVKGSKVYNYLVSRKIFDHSDIYEGDYWHTNNWNEPVLISLNKSNSNKVLGLQTRNLEDDRKKRRYKIFSFSELYMMVHNKEIDEIEQIGYNRLSYLYNILNIDWDKKITIFEGYLDAKLFPNSVGCVGTNTDINFILNQEDSDLQFFYDYDKTGILKSIEKINNGYSVFLWERLFDFWSSKIVTDPNKAGRELRKKIVDLGNIVRYVPQDYIKKLSINKWFSKDRFDLMYIKSVKDDES